MLNKLGTTQKMVIYHENGKKSYEFKTYSDGFSEEITFDKNGKILTFKDSEGFSCEFTRDEQGEKLAYKDSNGYYEIKRKKVYQEEYEAFIQSLGKPKQQTAMQELIDNLEKVKNQFPDSLSNGIQWVLGYIKDSNQLKKEKQQTLLGVYEGQKNHSASDEENKIMAEHWFNETFKQKK